MLRAARAREGAEGLSRLALALALALELAACRRPVVEPKGELAGAWLREAPPALGFELRADGSLALLNLPAESGLAWNAARGELLLSTNDAAHVESHVTRLRIERLLPDALLLGGEDSRFAGAYRRAEVAHVRGVVTYRERVALGPDAHVEVELSRAGDGPVALQVFAARAQVPIGFDLSLLASGAEKTEYALRARIADRERTWFATPEPVPVSAGDEGLEIVLRSAR